MAKPELKIEHLKTGAGAIPPKATRLFDGSCSGSAEANTGAPCFIKSVFIS